MIGAYGHNLRPDGKSIVITGERNAGGGLNATIADACEKAPLAAEERQSTLKCLFTRSESMLNACDVRRGGSVHAARELSMSPCERRYSS